MLSVNYISVELEKLNQLINVRSQQFPLSLSFSFLALPAPRSILYYVAHKTLECESSSKYPLVS